MHYLDFKVSSTKRTAPQTQTHIALKDLIAPLHATPAPYENEHRLWRLIREPTLAAAPVLNLAQAFVTKRAVSHSVAELISRILLAKPLRLFQRRSANANAGAMRKRYREREEVVDKPHTRMVAASDGCSHAYCRKLGCSSEQRLSKILGQGC